MPARRAVNSPAHRPSLVATPNTPDNLNASLAENNDVAEKRERTRSRLVEIQLSASPASRNSFGSITSLNAVQLAEHYTSCMKLSNENKINAKNAFQLQLIDYMAMMLKKKESDLDNFQVASCTLDASTKIYAYRVDSIHSDAVKMAGGLLRSDNAKKKGDSDASDAEDGKENVDGEPKKRKRIKRSATVETNLKKINLKEVEVECRIDPFFKRMATKFDEGHSGGCHFLANLRILNDSQEIILSSNTPWWRNRQAPVEKSMDTVPIPIPNYEGIKSAEICPSFTSFTFCGWTPENDESIVCSEYGARFGADEVLGRDVEHAFDMNAIPEPVEEDISHNDMLDMDDGMDVDHDMDENTVGTVEVMGCNQKRGKSSWQFADLRKVLSIDPLEYSYFNKGAMAGWAGPNHWKIKPLLRRDDVQKKTAAGRKKVQEKITLGYERMAKEDDFKPADKRICLTDGTIEKWTDLKTTLPEDLHLNVSSLLSLFLKPAMAFNQKDTSAVEVDGVDPFDFDNENDKENYCTNLGNDDPNSDDEDGDVSGLPPMEDDPNKELSQAESGYDLVQAPNMVPNVYIPYAKRAKKMDMKRLQKTIFKIMTKKEKPEIETQSKPEEELEVGESYKFSDIFVKIPKELPSKEAQNLSFPLAFVALLHVTNDKTLKLEGSPDLTDLIITQDKKLCS